MPWSLILNVLLKTVGWILDIREADRQAREDFLKFIGTIESQQLASVNLNDSDRAQLNELKRRREKLNENS